MNKYLKNLEKIEFVLTNACTGRCKHCSAGAHEGAVERIDPRLCADAVRKIAGEYNIKTVMVFGGEPLLHPDAVEEIMSAARDMNVQRRQVITNGFFTTDREKIKEVAERLYLSGVNDLLLSVDAFHQETIPLGVVRAFAEEIIKAGVPLRLQPAWLVSPDDGNPYNEKTRELLESFSDLAVAIGEGNVVFPEGNAVKYLSEYFTDSAPQNPYIEDPCDIKCISFSSDGGVLGGNMYTKDVLKIIEEYTP